MFLVNSRLVSFIAANPKRAGSPYPEVTDAILPSSLTRVLPSTLVYSTTPPVLVCGTVSYSSQSRWFSRKQKETDSPLIKRSIRDPCSTLSADLPTEINALQVLRAVNAHALIHPFRHTALSTKFAFPDHMLPEGNRGKQDS